MTPHLDPKLFRSLIDVEVTQENINNFLDAGLLQTYVGNGRWIRLRRRSAPRVDSHVYYSYGPRKKDYDPKRIGPEETPGRIGPSDFKEKWT